MGVFTVFGAVILFAAMDNVAEVFFAQDTLQADGWGYGLLASAWILGIVIGASRSRAACARSDSCPPCCSPRWWGARGGDGGLFSPAHPVIGQVQVAASWWRW